MPLGRHGWAQRHPRNAGPRNAPTPATTPGTQRNTGHRNPQPRRPHSRKPPWQSPHPEARCPVSPPRRSRRPRPTTGAHPT
ncbi:hypothetical protein EJ357_18055 [Streptomyces cyaneochromogenes]|uniref:Uncharacterized protein n=1 Tax=Streptomyces cyaneochromogenes TaxID=2496836 RepID=A0A3S9M7M7_9ACTN|nr:hypothetical protein EJ357_18055 [Streptomyces cyaneochromogenes]